ncbi:MULTISPECIES: GPR1/FUN34/YaaH family transporter [Streptomyces]|uniref:GPR1/FUN34/YaaH family transporter n=1 Tax=Streptomyces TaxID=1883 RepID=UPI000AA4685D|nr:MULTISPECIES: GPR1/FUN34/YaaH family transporter [Streptomyces]MDH6228459.1 succinate-acetate transporter protein [Streptomyces sp. MJP52]
MADSRSPDQVPPVVVHLRPLASPLPMGFLGLAGGTFVVAASQLEWLPPAQGKAVAIVLLAFVLPLQSAASVLGFLCRDDVAATGMAVLSGTWLSLGLIMLSSPPGSTSKAAGLLLLLAALALWAPIAAAGTAKLVASLVLVVASLRFAATGVHELSAAEAWKHVAGVIGLVLTAVALYAAFALVLEDQRQRTVLPTWRRGKGAEALTGDRQSRTGQVTGEAGVRRQL